MSYDLIDDAIWERLAPLIPARRLAPIGDGIAQPPDLLAELVVGHVADPTRSWPAQPAADHRYGSAMPPRKAQREVVEDPVPLKQPASLVEFGVDRELSSGRLLRPGIESPAGDDLSVRGDDERGRCVRCCAVETTVGRSFRPTFAGLRLGHAFAFRLRQQRRAGNRPRPSPRIAALADLVAPGLAEV